MATEIPEVSSEIPIYQQIANVLRAQIVSDDPSQPRRLPSEKDLARIHGVARGTVRCALDVLGNEGLITRTPGQPTMTSPERIAAYLRLRHRRAIVVLAADWTDAEVPSGYWGQIYQGILAASEQAGYRCSLRWIEGKLKPVDIKPGVEDPEEVLGVINMHILDQGLIARYIETGVPVVCVDFWPVYSQVDGVVADCFAEAHQAVGHLLANGHRNLFYAGNTVGTGAIRQPEVDSIFMEAGYRRAVQAAGLTASADHVHFCRQEEAEELMAWFLGLQARPTAGIIFNRTTMESFITELQKRGLRCPEDLSLICKTYEGEPTTATTMCVDAFRLGRSATELLLGRASGKYEAGIRVAFESRLKRGSTVRAIPS